MVEGKPSSATPAAEGALLVNPDEGRPTIGEGNGGPVAGICEAFMLIWCIPGFGCVSLYTAFMSGGATLAWTFVFPNMETEIWAENAATNTAWMNAARCFFSVLLCAHFGMWSDKHGRKIAVVVMTVASLIPGLPILAFGITQTGMNWVVALVVITGPFAAHVSGSPVLWAWASDYLAPEHKEIGFAIIGAVSSAGAFVVLVGANAIGKLYPGSPAPYLWMTVGCLIACLGIIAITPPGAYQPELTDADAAEEKGMMQAMFGPMRLVGRSPTLRAACIVVALLTLPDMAATDISANIIISLNDYVTPCKLPGQTPAQIQNCARSAITDTMTMFSVYPRPLTFVVMMVVGVCARRFGPHRLVRVWVPVTALLFAFPMILKNTFENWSILLSGFFILLPLTNYGPLQALVTHIVHPRQIGEAMGAIATCKNMVSLLAPLMVGAFTSALEKSEHTTYPDSLLYFIYPVCAIVMFCATPFTFCLEKRVPRDTTMTWNTWASAGRPTAIKSALNARSSAMYSARP